MAPAAKRSGAAANSLCIQGIRPTASIRAATEPTIGHGLGSTSWYSWCLACASAITLLSIPRSGAPALVRRRFHAAIRNRLRRLAQRVERIRQRDGVEVVEFVILRERRIEIEHHRHLALLA